MDTIKIKAKYLLFSGLTLSDKGLLMMIQALTAHLEREPSDKEILSLSGVGKKSLASLKKSLNVPLKDVIKKVMEDVTKYQQNTVAAKLRKQVSRSKTENVTRDVLVTSQTPHSRACFFAASSIEPKGPIDSVTLPAAIFRNQDSEKSQPAGDFRSLAGLDKNKFEQEVPPRICGLIDKIVKIRRRNGQDRRKPKCKPVESEPGLRRALSKNWEKEHHNWHEEIESYVAQRLKVRERRRLVRRTAWAKKEKAKLKAEYRKFICEANGLFEKMDKFRQNSIEKSIQNEFKDVPIPTKIKQELIAKRLVERGLLALPDSALKYMALF